jgi:hypothetical protein
VLGYSFNKINYLHVREDKSIGTSHRGIESENPFFLLSSAKDDSVVWVKHEEINQFVVSI